MAKSTPQQLRSKAAYNATEEAKNKRVIYNRNRRAAEREGIVHKGDGKAIDHIKPLANGGSDSPSNRRVIDAERNKGWRKGMKGNKVGKV